VAAQAGQAMQVELLVVNGADPCRLDRLGHTPEECARSANHKDTMTTTTPNEKAKAKIKTTADHAHTLIVTHRQKYKLSFCARDRKYLDNSALHLMAYVLIIIT